MKRRTWIKLFVDQMLRGTCFKELEPDERFVWIGFLLLAGDSPIEGQICIQEGMGYTDQQIAAMLKIDIGLLERAKGKCVQFDKIRVVEGGVVEIVNWKKYQSEYMRQRPYRQRAKHVSPGPPSSDSDPDEEVEEEGEGKVTPRYKSRLQAKVTGREEGLLPIPPNLPFDVKDRFVKWRADIRERRRILKDDPKTASCRRITESSIEASNKEFNESIKDYS